MSTHPRSAMKAYAGSGRAWWETAISETGTDRIVNRGHRIQDLIGRVSFAQHVVLLFTGRLIPSEQAALVEAVLVAAGDPGPRAPSIAAARMAATCGVTFNSAIATGINLLGEYHGGAGAGAARLLREVRERVDAGEGTLAAIAAQVVADHRSRRALLPGFGHQQHTRDPRRDPIVALLQAARQAGAVDGRFLDLAFALEAALQAARGKPLYLNVDGATAVVCCELGLPDEFAIGIFCLARAAGIMAHAYEEQQTGVRIKGPCPAGPELVRYTGEQPAE